MFSRLRRTKLVAIKNFDEELYRLVKTYASLEGRTVASIFEEAIRYWMENRKDYNEIRLWVSLERSYEDNIRVLEKNSSLLEKYEEGYALICDKRLIGVFKDYEEAARKSLEKCKVHALIIKLPYSHKTREIELGLPW